MCSSAEWRSPAASYILQEIDETDGEIAGVTIGDGLIVAPHICASCGYVRLQLVREESG
jgi:hypothetical protein